MKEDNINICPNTMGVNWDFHTCHSTHKYGDPALLLMQMDSFALERHGNRVNLAGF